jgi:hypothetical protein
MRLRGSRDSAAHLIEERSTKIPAQCKLSTVGKFHDVISVKKWVQSAYSRLANQNGSVYSKELLRIERVF